MTVTQERDRTRNQGITPGQLPWTNNQQQSDDRLGEQRWCPSIERTWSANLCVMRHPVHLNLSGSLLSQSKPKTAVGAHSLSGSVTFYWSTRALHRRWWISLLLCVRHPLHHHLHHHHHHQHTQPIQRGIIDPCTNSPRWRRTCLWMPNECWGSASVCRLNRLHTGDEAPRCAFHAR